MASNIFLTALLAAAAFCFAGAAHVRSTAHLTNNFGKLKGCALKRVWIQVDAECKAKTASSEVSAEVCEYAKKCVAEFEVAALELPVLQIVRVVAGGAVLKNHKERGLFGNMWSAIAKGVQGRVVNFPTTLSMTALECAVGDNGPCFPDPGFEDYKAKISECTVDLGVGKKSEKAGDACEEPKGNGRFGVGVAAVEGDKVTHIWVDGGLQIELQYNGEGEKYQCNSLDYRFTVCKLPKPAESLKWTSKTKFTQ